MDANRTDQQATNAALAALAAAGNSFALGQLWEVNKGLLRRRYYEGKTLRAIGEEIGVKQERVRQIEAGAFRKLRRNPQLARWRDEVISTRA